MSAKRVLSLIGLLALGLGGPGLAQDTGRIEGRVAREDGGGVGGVTVAINEVGMVGITGTDGAFRFFGVPAGTYSLSFTLGDHSDTEDGVGVAAGATTTVDREVDWELSFADTITVVSASRRRERIVEAPAAVTVITEEQISRESAHGQLPKLLEHTPGAETTQSGLYDFNFNSRGFNSSLNRRILVLVDGRDPSLTFLSSQEWYGLTIPLDTLASVELVRGPGSALYGADAYNGVINMVTKSPVGSTGGSFKLTAGELSMGRADFSVAGELGGGWHGRALGGYLESDEFAQSRHDRNGDGVAQVGTEVEYAGLGLEPIPLPQNRAEAFWGNLRLDRELAGGAVISIETGYTEFEAGAPAITGIGRTEILKTDRSHIRVNLNTPHWNLLAYRNDRESPVTAMRSGAPLFLDSDKIHGEVQGNIDFSGGRGRLIGGGSYAEENFDSTLPGVGVQTLVFSPVEADFTGVFGQLEYDFSPKVRGVFSTRWDDSSLYDSQTSPRGALVFSLSRNHTVRVSYAEAFQSPNYSEFFLQVPVAPSTTALAGLEFLLCAPFGVQCGLDSVPIMALGNPTVEVEEIQSFEVGYSGILGDKGFLTIDYYNSQLENFLTDLITSFNPQLGGFFNPAFGRYQPPAGIPEPFASQLQAIVLENVPVMTNHPLTGLAMVNAVTYANFGEVDTQGIELGLNVRLDDEWLLNIIYNWFDFEVKNQLAADPLLSNAPETQYGFGLSRATGKTALSVKYRHVDGFDWAAGVFAGPIPAYDLVDLTASYDVNERVSLGLNVSNLFDEDHYQIFGGDIIQRRALAHVELGW
jgi:iron complex outermembrane receptor protein